jgi:hypothetical protein
MGKKTDLFEGRRTRTGVVEVGPAVLLSKRQTSSRGVRGGGQKDRPLRGAFEGAVKKTDLFEGREGAMDPFDGAW